MGSLVLTIIGAFILMGIVVACLAIGRLITGKNRLKRGTCGMIPQKGKEKPRNCSICGAEKPCEQETDKGKMAKNGDDNGTTDRETDIPK